MATMATSLGGVGDGSGDGGPPAMADSLAGSASPSGFHGQPLPLPLRPPHATTRSALSLSRRSRPRPGHADLPAQRRVLANHRGAAKLDLQQPTISGEQHEQSIKSP